VGGEGLRDRQSHRLTTQTTTHVNKPHRAER
jgi:hypothetical protein